MLSRFLRPPLTLTRRIRAPSSPIFRALALGGVGAAAFASASACDAVPTHLPRFLCNAQQPETDVKVPEQPAPAQNSESKGGKTDPPGFGSGIGATPSSTAVSDAAISMAAAAAAEASAAAAAAAAAALDAANAIPSPGPVTDPATNVAAAAEVIYAAGIARPPSVLDSQADAVAQTQQHSQILVGDQQQVKAAAIIPPLVGSTDNYKQLYENAVAELNKRATDEAARLRAAMRMQGEEDVVKFRHVLLRELLAERERLQRVLDSKLATMKDVFASEMQKREDVYALRIEQAVGTVRDVAVAHVQQETDVVKAVATSEMQQEIMNAQETLSQEYAAKTGERVRMVQELSAKLAALDHHLSVRSDDSRRSHSVHQLTLAALGLQSALSSRRSISADMALVMRAAPHDNLVNMMAKSVPLTAASNGVASLHDLQCAFDAVATEGRRLSFVPRQGGVVAEAIGSFLAAIPEFTVHAAPIGDSADVLLLRAKQALAKGDVSAAVASVEKLNGRPADLAQAWLKQAKERLIVEQAVAVVSAHATTLAASLS